MKKIPGFQEKIIIKRGGKRENAGRKKGDPTTTISVRIPVKHAEDFKEKLKELKKLYI